MTPPVLNNDKRLFKLGGVIHFGGPEGDRTLEPHGCEPCALPAELRALIHIKRLIVYHATGWLSRQREPFPQKNCK